MTARFIDVGPTKMMFGEKDHQGPALLPLRESSSLLPPGPWPDHGEAITDAKAAISTRLEEDGYVYLPGLLDRGAVLRAKARVMQYMDDQGGILEPSHASEGVLQTGCGLGCVPFLEGHNKVTHSEELTNVLESPILRQFFQTFIFGEAAATFDFSGF